MHGDEEQVWVPLVQETLYPVMADPLSDGVSQRRIALLSALVPKMLVGALGVVAGVTLGEDSESGDSPSPFRAFTLKV